MSDSLQIKRVDPAAGIAGGEVRVEYKGVPGQAVQDLDVTFAGQAAHLTALGGGRALVVIPEIHEAGKIEVVVAPRNAEASPAAEFIIGEKLAGGLHPVTNPTFDPLDGSLYVTRSGARGEHVPVSIFRIASDGTIEDFSSDIINPTSIAFDRTGRMFVTSRFDGTVYRISPERDVIAFAADLGVATGMAFNRNGEMFVGDRSGTIYRINEIGEARPWAQHEPSVSAYHLAFGPDDALYITGPTVSSFDSVTRFDEEGRGSTFHLGLGRPQGLAFDREGNLYVTAAVRGRRGIVRISPDGSNAELIAAGMNLVGLAFSGEGAMVVASNEAVYRLRLGIQGLLVR
jgi:sugar lactone lactonase YvrE